MNYFPFLSRRTLMYTLKKVEQIFNKAMEYFNGRMYASLDSYLKKYDLSTDVWSYIFRSVREFINQNQISIFLTDEYFKQEYIHCLNQQHLIIDIGKTCSPLNISREN